MNPDGSLGGTRPPGAVNEQGAWLHQGGPPCCPRPREGLDLRGLIWEMGKQGEKATLACRLPQSEARAV